MDGPLSCGYLPLLGTGGEAKSMQVHVHFCNFMGIVSYIFWDVTVCKMQMILLHEGVPLYTPSFFFVTCRLSCTHGYGMCMVVVCSQPSSTLGVLDLGAGVVWDPQAPLGGRGAVHGNGYMYGRSGISNTFNIHSYLFFRQLQGLCMSVLSF